MLFFLQSPGQILNKIRSYSHGEFDQKNINEKNIQEKILKNEDIFNRGFSLKKVNLDNSYPEYILKNKKKFLEWII